MKKSEDPVKLHKKLFEIAMKTLPQDIGKVMGYYDLDEWAASFAETRPVIFKACYRAADAHAQVRFHRGLQKDAEELRKILKKVEAFAAKLRAKVDALEEKP